MSTQTAILHEQSERPLKHPASRHHVERRVEAQRLQQFRVVPSQLPPPRIHHFQHHTDRRVHPTLKAACIALVRPDFCPRRRRYRMAPTIMRRGQRRVLPLPVGGERRGSRRAHSASVRLVSYPRRFVPWREAHGGEARLLVGLAARGFVERLAGIRGADQYLLDSYFYTSRCFGFRSKPTFLPAFATARAGEMPRSPPSRLAGMRLINPSRAPTWEPPGVSCSPGPHHEHRFRSRWKKTVRSVSSPHSRSKRPRVTA